MLFSDLIPCVTTMDNDALLTPFLSKKNRRTLFKMHSEKALSPDGMNATFFQKCWHIIGDDIFSHCCKWLNRGEFPPTVNDTTIALIPKKPKSNSTNDLSPIALCNVVQKLVANVLANRLKALLPRIISLSQLAFVPRRLITDNVMVAFEVIHHMKNKGRCSVGEVALKIGIKKAYDRVD